MAYLGPVHPSEKICDFVELTVEGKSMEFLFLFSIANKPASRSDFFGTLCR